MQSDLEAFEQVSGLYHELAVQPRTLIRLIGYRKCEAWKRQKKAEIRRLLRQQGLTVRDYERFLGRLG